VRVEGLSGVRTFACGADHSLALKENGTVWAWGSNASGQLGLGASGDRTSPAKVRGLSEIVAVRAGAGHSLALDAAGRVWAWGDNRYGQLGPAGPAGFSDIPLQVAGLQGVRSVEAGGRHSVALLADGSVWAWGDNLFGQLGAQTPNSTSPEPVRVAGLPAAEGIRAGLEHSLALLRDATLWAWGANFSGQLGDGTVESRHEARAVAGLSGVVAFAAGGAHGLAVLEDETLWVWGSNRYGQLGDGTLEDRRLPVPISDLAAVKEVRAGWDRSFAVTEKRLTVASMKKKADPFRIVVTGAHFDENIKVFIHGWQWPLVDWVSSQKLVLRGKGSLKSSVPRGTPTEFRFQNPDGEALTLWWQWD
jgi:alpha-tubulin suppressor-like RCC1 family protein